MKARLFFSGDYYSKRSVSISALLRETINHHDIAVINFEAPLMGSAPQKIPKAGPHLQQTEQSIEQLKEFGFTAVSLANNHIFDYGAEGLTETISNLKQRNLSYFGAGLSFDDAYRPFSTTVNGVRIAFLAAGDSEFGHIRERHQAGGYAWINHPCIEDSIITLKQSHDHVIVISHCGSEMLDIPLPEWRARYQRLCDKGASAIIGHHPHVPQGFERYGSAFIFYSLGEFFFDTSKFDERRTNSYSASLTIDKNSIAAAIIPHCHNGTHIVIDDNNKSKKRYAELNKLLEEPQYSEEINRNIEALYNRIYEPYYQIAVNGIASNAAINQKLVHFIKSWILPFIYRKKIKTQRDLMLLHNISIDTHRYVAQRALEKSLKVDPSSPEHRKGK